MAGALLNGGLYEPENIDVILSFVRPDTVFLDIGANVGIFSLLVGRRLKAGGKVHAFEPQAHLAEFLKRSAFLNGLGSLEGHGVIETHCAGVSDRSAKASFTIPGGHLGGGRIVPGAQGDQTIPVVRLDDFFDRKFCCDLIKIDVEVHELQAIEGMQRILLNSPRLKILFENLGVSLAQAEEIETMLQKFGLQLFGVDHDATLVPLGKGELARWNGYAVAGKTGDPDLIERHRRRISVYPAQLNLQSAALESGVLKSRAGMGQIVFHGPYWFLPRGQYRIMLDGQLKGSLAVTIATRFGYPLATCLFADGVDSSEFTIERDAVLFECVARAASEETELSLNKIDIMRR